MAPHAEWLRHSNTAPSSIRRYRSESYGRRNVRKIAACKLRINFIACFRLDATIMSMGATGVPGYRYRTADGGKENPIIWHRSAHCIGGQVVLSIERMCRTHISAPPQDWQQRDFVQPGRSRTHPRHWTTGRTLSSLCSTRDASCMFKSVCWSENVPPGLRFVRNSTLNEGSFSRIVDWP